MRETYESRELDCTPEQVAKAAYPEPEPSAAWREFIPMTPEQEALAKRLKRWNGDWEWEGAPSAHGSLNSTRKGNRGVSRSRTSTTVRSTGG